MPKVFYVGKMFNAKQQLIIQRANEVIESYEKQGYNLTLRQLYYQFVSRGWLENTVGNYKMLGGVISDARRAGLIDWDSIIDRTRYLRSHTTWDSPQQILKASHDGYTKDLWEGQAYRPEVWVEKDALIGVIQVACDPLQVPYFSCRGYTSDSEIWGAARRMERNSRIGQVPYIIHLGDHDPSGIDMSRDIRDRLNLFRAGKFHFVRIALNYDQIEQYNPPPNPAKETDSRFKSYQELYGDESWELDALEPSVLTELIRTEIDGRIDQTKWATTQETIKDDKRRIADAIGYLDKPKRERKPAKPKRRKRNTD